MGQRNPSPLAGERVKGFEELERKVRENQATTEVTTSKVRHRRPFEGTLHSTRPAVARATLSARDTPDFHVDDKTLRKAGGMIRDGRAAGAAAGVAYKDAAIHDQTPGNWRSIHGHPPLAERVPAIRPLDSPVFQFSGFGEHSQPVGRAAVGGPGLSQRFLHFTSGPPLTITEVV